MDDEIWKPIRLDLVRDYKPAKHGCLATVLFGYEASSYGRIRKPDGTIQHIGQRKDGYQYICVYVNGKHRNLLVHRLIAAAFHPVPLELGETFAYNSCDGIPYIVNHLDEDPSNNKYKNLEWCDNSRNIDYTYSRFNNPRGLKVFMTDVETNNTITFRSTREVARYLGTAQSTASEAIKRNHTIPYNGRYIFKIDNPEQHKLKGYGVLVPVVLYNELTNEVSVIENCPDASGIVKCDSRSIYERVIGKSKTNKSINGYRVLSLKDYEERVNAFNNGLLDNIWTENFINRKEIQMSDFVLYRAYAGLGDGATPPEILEDMTKIAAYLDEKGYTLRTSGNEGPDEAFEKSSSKMEVHLPWKFFNKKESKFCKNDKESFNIVKKFMPVFDTLKPAVQAIIARNAHVVLGKSLDSPIKFLVCWTPDGCETVKDKNAKTGWIGLPIALTASFNIPVFNLRNPDAKKRLMDYLKED